MAQNQTFEIGDRVQVTMFAHKGKIGEVKFFGELPKKFGKWVGLELDVSKSQLTKFRNQLGTKMEKSMVRKSLTVRRIMACFCATLKCVQKVREPRQSQ
jgi:dynactin complex subunit